MENVYTYYKQDDSFEYRHSTAIPPEGVPTNNHDYFELYYFISGDMLFYIEGQAYHMNKGDFLIINNDELHRAQPQSDAPYERIVIHFTRNFLSGFGKEEPHLLNFVTKRKLGHSNRLEASKIDTSPIFHHLSQIDKALIEHSHYTPLLVKTIFLQLLIVLNKTYCTQTESIITPKHYDERVTAILKYLNDNIENKVSLNELETLFFMNKYHLCHLFKKNTGFTVFEYISNKRIMKAKQLLSKGIPVIETCYAVGFSDYSNFYKVFKRIAGIPPKQYAMQN